ncbi:MAG TPA: hypothetical protein VNQ73_10770 [Ilumatobacter sp.]|nr:hypothetical protein [Ilumatobacter sp.]
MTDLAFDSSPEHTDETPAAPAVRGPLGPGPLAPYRFALSLGFAAVVAGEPLVHAAQGGDGLERALLRAFAAATVMWFPTGLINRLLMKTDDTPT